MSNPHIRWSKTLALGMIAALVFGGTATGLAQPREDEPDSAADRGGHGGEDKDEPEGPGGAAHGQMMPPGGDNFGERPFFEPRFERDWPRIGEFLEEHFPGLADELRRLERVNPRLFRRRLREVAPRVMHLAAELERDEELGMLGIEEERLNFEIRHAVRRYFNTSDKGRREELRAELEAKVRRQFDIRQRRGERTIGKLEARLERLRRQMERRARKREDIITRDLEQLLDPHSPREPQHDGAPPGRPGGPRRDRVGP